METEHPGEGREHKAAQGKHWKEKRDDLWQKQREAARKSLKSYEPPEYGLAVLNELRIDERYQRVRSQAKVNTLRATFQPNACQPLSVSLRADGQRYLIDGQHRAAALDDIGMPSWPALIYRKLTLRDEAAMWSELNTRQTKPSSSERFRAALQRGDSEALAIARITTENGFEIRVARAGRGQVKISGRQIDAIEALIRVYHTARAPGLRDVLRTVLTAWPDPDELNATQRLVLLGIHGLLAGPWAPRLDLVRAAQIIGRFTPSAWIAKTRGVTSGEPPHRILTEKFRMAYNKSASKKEKL